MANQAEIRAAERHKGLLATDPSPESAEYFPARGAENPGRPGRAQGKPGIALMPG
ncbi:hypothetical protein ACQEVY_12155 [Streptomyces sp. CA-288835]|uniref:hypothetical protein n=1 Tax=Streptomyces sp. CA-288835 TaxID=3240069 RepID=UPI003D91BDA1